MKELFGELSTKRWLDRTQKQRAKKNGDDQRGKIGRDTHCDPQDLIAMARVVFDELAGLGVPQSDRPVLSARQHVLSAMVIPRHMHDTLLFEFAVQPRKGVGGLVHRYLSIAQIHHN